MTLLIDTIQILHAASIVSVLVALVHMAMAAGAYK